MMSETSKYEMKSNLIIVHKNRHEVEGTVIDGT